MIVFVDIDDTICSSPPMRYDLAKPNCERIKRINEMYDEGHTIVYWTGRGTLTNVNHFKLTQFQLDEWGCKYHELRMGKPVYDLFIDDKNISSDVFFGEESWTQYL